MGTKTITEHVICELVSDNRKKTYTPKLKLSVNEYTPDEELSPVKRWVIGEELTPMSSVVIENGNYTLRYSFNGERQEHRVRVEGNRLRVA